MPAAALLLLLLPVGPARAGDGAPLGQRVWLESCATCHGTEGAGDGPSARHLSARPPDLRTGRLASRSTPWDQAPTDEDLARTIRRGVAGSPMPGFQGHLSPAAIDAVTGHLRGLVERWATPPPAPVLPEPPADLSTHAAEGQALFAAACAACHGPLGRGDGPAAAFLVDGEGAAIRPRDLRREALRGGERPEDLFRAVSFGLEGRAMPPFGYLSEAERWALVAYVQTLRPARAPWAVGVVPRPSRELR